MDNAPLPESKAQTTEPPQPEALKPRVEEADPAAEPAPVPHSPASPATGKRPKHRNYRPSHKATFIGAAVVIVILVVNAGILAFVLKNQTKTIEVGANGDVTVSPSVLKKLGVNSTTLGSPGVQLVVDPNAQFNGKLSVAGNVNISGQVQVNNKLTSTDASLNQLEAGNTALSQLNVNGSSTLSNLNLRNGLVVTGATQLQGAVTISQLLTVDNSLNVVGNVAVGGTLSTKTFSANSLTSTSTLTIGGHVVTGGSTPSAGPGGPALGSNGTVSISGNDTAGVIDINIGTGASGGTLVNVAFHTQYGITPRVVISPVGVAGEFYVLNLTSSGFSVGVGGSLPPGGYAINYIVEQ
jgi:hypothetical protein